MPVLQLRRQRPTAAEEEDDDDEQPSHNSQARHYKRRTNGAGSDAESPEEDYSDEDEPVDETERDETAEGQMVKRLIRYALACDFSRIPIRRDGIKEKVLGERGRAFRKVFDATQMQLIDVFGMEMVEMPTRDKATLSLDQKRKAGKSQAQRDSTSHAYMLVSRLPDAYRQPAVIAPSLTQAPEDEAAYVAFYTTLISIITLSGGELSDARFQRQLTRLNATVHTPAGKTDDVLQRLVRQNYLVKQIEKNQGEDETITWFVGSRGKLEVTNEAIAKFVREIYGGHDDQLEKKLQTSLQVRKRKLPVADGNADANGNGVNTANGEHGGGSGDEGAEEEDGDEGEEL